MCPAWLVSASDARSIPTRPLSPACCTGNRNPSIPSRQKSLDIDHLSDHHHHCVFEQHLLIRLGALGHTARAVKKNRVAHQDLFEVGRQVLQPKPFRPITAPYRSRRLEPQSTHRATRRAAPPEIQLGRSHKGTSSSWPPHRSRGPERSSLPCPSTW